MLLAFISSGIQILHGTACGKFVEITPTAYGTPHATRDGDEENWAFGGGTVSDEEDALTKRIQLYTPQASQDGQGHVRKNQRYFRVQLRALKIFSLFLVPPLFS